MITLPPPPRAGKDTKARAQARAALLATLWTREQRRRLPDQRELAAALSACDPRDVWWVCEASSAGPVYLLPTRQWIAALAAWLDEVKARSVLEVAAGDGFLSRCLQKARPQLRVIATDNHSWTKASARSSPQDAHEFRGVVFAGIRPDDVEKIGAVAAVKREQPDVVIVSWAPPGTLVERVIRAPSRLVLDIGVDGDVCGNGPKTWRFFKELLDGPLEARALCRLDAQPQRERHTRVTVYYGRAHALHGIDKDATC